MDCETEQETHHLKCDYHIPFCYRLRICAQNDVEGAMHYYTYDKPGDKLYNRLVLYLWSDLPQTQNHFLLTNECMLTW